MKRLNQGLTALAIIAVAAAMYSVFFHKQFKKEADPIVKFSSIIRLVREGYTFCSGTVISDDLLITASHCVLQRTELGFALTPEPIEVRPSTNEDVKLLASVVIATGQMDQAVLTGDFRLFNSRNYYTKPEEVAAYMTPGQKFVSCGYPRGGALYCTTMAYVKPDDFFWAMHGVLIPGMSGGPVMVDGVVVAVNSAVMGEYAIVSPIYNILTALKK